MGHYRDCSTGSDHHVQLHPSKTPLRDNGAADKVTNSHTSVLTLSEQMGVDEPEEQQAAE